MFDGFSFEGFCDAVKPGVERMVAQFDAERSLSHPADMASLQDITAGVLQELQLAVIPIFQFATERPFDLIFLDVVMPGVGRLEVCSKICDTIVNHATPVVFITSKNDFIAQAEIRRNGDDDIMGRPFLTTEITVKTLMFAWRGRLQRHKT